MGITVPLVFLEVPVWFSRHLFAWPYRYYGTRWVYVLTMTKSYLEVCSLTHSGVCSSNTLRRASAYFESSVYTQTSKFIPPAYPRDVIQFWMNH